MKINAPMIIFFIYVLREKKNSLTIPGANLGRQLSPAFQTLLSSLLATELSHARRTRLQEPYKCQNEHKYCDYVCRFHLFSMQKINEGLHHYWFSRGDCTAHSF